jgi:hypothetical protein
MTKGGSKYMKIKLEADTGKLIKVSDEKNVKATELTPEELQQLYQNPGLKFVGVILQAQTNPQCSYYIYQGYAYRICF